MSVLRALRKLLLGETWTLPIGVALTIGVPGLALRPLDRTLWHDAGAAVLVVVVVLLLVWSVARGARPRKR